jgi:hypothetical protein
VNLLGTCFGHVMFKTCQYATNDDKVFYGFNFGERERNSKKLKTNKTFSFFHGHL